MIRRPITSIELKLDDLQEYTSKKEQVNNSQAPSDPNTSLQKYNFGTKTTKEIHERIGLNPKRTNVSL